MERPWRLVFTLLLALLIIAPSFQSAHGVSSYQPAVSPGRFAHYKPLYNVCTLPVLAVCQSIAKSFGGTSYGSIQVVSVQGQNVTLSLMTNANGTSSRQGALVNVSTGASNITSLMGTSSNYFVLAAGLQAHDKIWNTTDAPTFNQTVTEPVLGTYRAVNLLNYTTSYSQNMYPASITIGLAFDQETGILVELSFSAVISVSGYFFHAGSAIGMLDNNMWPYFTMASSGPISFETGSSGSSTITITAKNGFGETIHLQFIPTSGLSCLLSKATLPGYGNFTVTCRGEPGTYTANINATSDSTTRSAPVSVEVAAAPAPNQPTSNLAFIIYAAIGTIAIIAVLAAYLLMRKKPAQASNRTSGITSNPPAQ